MIVTYLDDITIDLVYDNDLEKSFVLPVPDSFEIEYVKDSLRSKFRDYNFILRPGKHRYKVLVTFGYETHRMEIKELIGAKEITLRFPPDVEELQVFEAKLLNKTFLKDYFQGLVIGGPDNPIPSGNLSLEFELVGSFTWNQILEMKWFMNEDTDVPDNIVLLLPEDSSETGLQPLFTWETVDNADSYQIQVSTTEEFDGIIIDESTIGGSYEVDTDLDGNTTYYWRVRGVNTFGNGNWSSRQFTTEVVFAFKSLLGNGSTQYVNLTTLGSFGSSIHNFTIEFWIKTDSTSLGTLVGTVNDGTTEIFVIGINTNRDEAYLAGSIMLQIRNGSGLQRRMAAQGAGIDNNVKHHVAVINNSGSFEIYVDGVGLGLTIGSAGGNDSLAADNYNNFQYSLNLFCRNVRGSNDKFLDAKISDLRIWNVVRTQAQIIDNMDTRFETPQANLIANYLTLSNGGNTLEEVNGDFNGTLVNNASDNMWDSEDLV